MLVFNYDKDLPKINDLKLDYFRKHVNNLHNIFQPVQKSKEWYEMRNGLLTASDWGKILDAKTDVMLKKCGEDRFVGGAAIDWGNKYEEVANLIYQNRNNVEVLEFGCLRHPNYDFLGASPDGITPDGIMVEIKCPYTRKITGIPKYEYWCQVQGQLEVCDLDRCDFIECCLKEYTDETEYLNDNYNGNFLLNKLGNEKGVICEFYNKIEKKYMYIYSKISICGNELDEWKINVIKENETENITFFTFYYWNLEEVSCIPIYRNQEWFNNALPILKAYWDNILFYRNAGLYQLKDDITNGYLLLEKMVHNRLLFENKPDQNKLEVVKQCKKKQKKINDYIDITDIGNNNTNNSTNNIDYDDMEFSIDMNISFFSD